MRNGHLVGVVIPALDEEQAIGHVVRAIPNWVDEILVVDNASSDGTGAAARAAGARVVVETERGYGAACLAGIQALQPTDIIVFLDGDFSDAPEEMNLLVDPIANDQADFVVGSRVRGELATGALTPQQRVGNWIACRLMHLLWDSDWSDLGPFRAIRAGALRELDMQDRGYGWTIEMQLNAARAGLRQKEVPVSYRPRVGRSKISGTLKGTLMAGFTILRLIARSANRNAQPAAGVQ